jgi:hypothetical protein
MRSRTFSIRCSAHSIITVPAKTLAYGVPPARRPFRPADAQIFRRLLDYPFSLHILAHSFAVNEISTLFFSSGSALFGEKNTGGGVPLPADPPAQSEGAPTERLHRQTCVRVFSVRRDSWAHFTKDGWTKSQACWRR